MLYYTSRHEATTIRWYSSAGRALEWHSRGQRFDPAYLHQKSPEIVRFQDFFLCLRVNKSVHYFLHVPRVEYLLNRARNCCAVFLLWPILNEGGGCRSNLHPPPSPLHFLSMGVSEDHSDEHLNAEPTIWKFLIVQPK